MFVSGAQKNIDTFSNIVMRIISILYPIHNSVCVGDGLGVSKEMNMRAVFVLEKILEFYGRPLF